ncbi:MAG: peptide protein [Sediminibacterium sp.]|nr:peptide protein [Sediminibacterium sp.]
MKKLWVFVAFLIVSLASFAAPNPDDILGVWINSSGQGQIQIYKEGGKYFGKIVWLKEPNGPNGHPKLDAKNPDETQRSKPLLGAVVLRGFSYDAGEWTGGRIYDPQNGKDYKCYMKLKDPKTLTVRGYIGISLLGRTEIWTKK